MNSDLTANCTVRIKYRYHQTKEPMMITNDATEPWQKVGANLFQISGKDYLIAIDYYSNYPEVAVWSSTTAEVVITHMKSIFGRHRIPSYLLTDNGPQSVTIKVKQFEAQCGFEHTLSSPFFAQANSKAEKGVQIMKRMWEKCQKQGSYPYLALLSHRAAPLLCGKSPAEIMGRQLRSRLPRAIFISNKPHALLPATRSRQKQFYDKSTKQLPKLKAGNTVRILSDRGWDVRDRVKCQVAPPSYKVTTEAGGTYVRNRRHLLHTQESIQPDAYIPDTPSGR